MKSEKKDNQLVSIAMCTYNGEKYLSQQLESILNQTYRNLEIIIVDDGSTDRTIEIMSEYQQKDERIKIFQNAHNLGFVQNFAKAISLCTGDYIALSDQDDIWKLEKIEKFVKEIGENLLIYSDAILIDNNNNKAERNLIEPYANLISGKCNKAFLFSNCVSGNTMMFKRELLEYILPIPDVSFHDIWIAFIASTVGTIVFTEEAMIYYRRHNEQVTTRKTKSSKKKIILNRFKIKKIEKITASKKIIKDLEAYKEASIKLNDLEIENIINMLLEHYYHYEKSFINFKLRRKLIEALDELFAILLKKKRLKEAKKVSLGLRYHQCVLFT